MLCIAKEEGKNFTWSPSSDIQFATKNIDKTWEPANGIRFADKQRLKIWHPGSAIVFGGPRRPTVTGRLVDTQEAQIRYFVAGTSQHAPGRLPPAKRFDPSRQRKADIPPIKLPSISKEQEAQVVQNHQAEDISKRAETPDFGFQLLAMSKTQIHQDLEKSEPASTSIPEHETPFQPMAAHSPDGKPARKRQHYSKTVQQSGLASPRTPKISKESSHKHTNATPPSSRRIVRRQRARTADRDSVRLVPWRRTLPSSQIPSPAPTAPTLYSLLTTENFLLSSSEILKQHERQRLPRDAMSSNISEDSIYKNSSTAGAERNGPLVISLTPKQREILWTIRSTSQYAFTLSQCLQFHDHFCGEFEELFREWKIITRSISESIIETKRVLKDLIALVPGAQNPKLRTRATSLYLPASERINMLHLEVLTLSHLIRACVKYRTNTLFNFLEQEFSLGSHGFHSHSTSLTNFRIRLFHIKLGVLREQMQLDSSILFNLVDQCNYTAVRLRQAKEAESARKVFAVLARVVKSIFSIRERFAEALMINWLAVLDIPAHLSLIEKLSPWELSLAHLLYKIQDYASLKRYTLAQILGYSQLGSHHGKEGLGDSANRFIKAAISFKLTAGDFLYDRRTLHDLFYATTGLTASSVVQWKAMSLAAQKHSHASEKSAFNLITRASGIWSHRLYRDIDGRNVITYYCYDADKVEEYVNLLRGYNVVGFDLEWSPSAKIGDPVEKNVSMIQLAGEHCIVLFHVARLFKSGERYLRKQTVLDQKLRALASLLKDPNIRKVGASIKADCTRLERHLGIQVQGALELSHLHSQLEYHTGGRQVPDKKATSLANLVQQYFQMQLPKDREIRLHDWSNSSLSLDHISYAAADAYAGLQLYRRMNALRKVLKPSPRLPAPVHLQEKIPCADDISGRYPQAKAMENSRAVKLVSPIELITEPSHFNSEDIGLVYGLPTKTALELSKGISDRWQLTRAEVYDQGGEVSNRALIAYTAWHIFGVPITDIADHYSTPPNAIITSILETLQNQRLPFESEALKKLLLPDLDELPLNTLQILKTRQQMLPVAEAFIRRNFARESNNRLLAYALWRCSKPPLSVAEVCLVLFQRPQDVLKSIHAGIIELANKASQSQDCRLSSFEEKLRWSTVFTSKWDGLISATTLGLTFSPPLEMFEGNQKLGASNPNIGDDFLPFNTSATPSNGWGMIASIMQAEDSPPAMISRNEQGTEWQKFRHSVPVSEIMDDETDFQNGIDPTGQDATGFGSTKRLQTDRSNFYVTNSSSRLAYKEDANASWEDFLDADADEISWHTVEDQDSAEPF